MLAEGAKSAPEGVGGDSGLFLKLGYGARRAFERGEYESFEGAHSCWLWCVPVDDDGEPDAGIGVAGGRQAGLGDRLGHDGDSAGECLDGEPGRTRNSGRSG